jgi:glucose/mannose-6-phosphate isomerase
MTAIKPVYSVDQQALLNMYNDWPVHFARASQISCSPDHEVDYYDSLLFCGMGGSATSCDILNDLNRFYGQKHSSILRGESMPMTVTNRSLVVVNSASGNTEEALDMANEAAKRGAEVICISSGGKLCAYADTMGFQKIKIPNLSLPRASLPYLIMPGLNLITPFLPDFVVQDLKLVPENLAEEKKHISSEIDGNDNSSRITAAFLKDSFVFCLTSPFMTSVGTRFKNSLNENAKIHCTTDSVLESMHNEIVPFTYVNKTFRRKVIFVTINLDSPSTVHKFKKIQQLFRDIGQPYLELSSGVHSLLLSILRMIYSLDFATLYVAIERGIDPSPTPAIDILKKL